MTPSRKEVNAAISRLAKSRRSEAVALLSKHGAQNTSELKPEDYPAVIREAEERLANVSEGALRAPITSLSTSAESATGSPQSMAAS
jgi:hypothetical protein